MFKKLVLALTCASFVGSSVSAHNSAEIDAAIQKAKNKEMCEKAENLAYKTFRTTDGLALCNYIVALVLTGTTIINSVNNNKLNIPLTLAAGYSIFNTCANLRIENKISKLRDYISKLKYSIV